MSVCMVASSAKNDDISSKNNFRSSEDIIKYENILHTQAEATTSAEKIANATTESAEEIIQEVVQFLDENAGQAVGYAAKIDQSTGLDSTPNGSSLGDFLKRPVRIATFTWLESDPAGTSHTYNPWNLFFNDARIKYKLNNYSFIQCDLKVKVLINASPFYYGAMLMSYQPLPNLAPASYNSITNDAGTRYFIPYSQRPHLWIIPQNNEGGEMTLPFFYNKNWLRVQKAQDFTDMGKLTFLNYTALASANGAVGTGVTVQIYAWAENVQLAGPSVGLAMQGQKKYVKKSAEYEGAVSKPASAVAEAAGILRKIPLIEPFATATQMGANFVASAAHALGFTNHPVISDVQPFRPAAIAPMATSEVSYPVEKLTIDPANELTIDPVIAGLRSVDELAICHLVQKESYLCTASWSTSNVSDDILWSSTVAPSMFDNDAQTYAKIYMTPMCWLMHNFASWRGDIIFRFRFIASPYHKGRVRIAYDPTGYSGENIISDATSTTAVYNQIVDLGKDTDIEIRVPYQQALAWLRCPNGPTSSTILWSTSASPSFNYDDTMHNGTIVMRCLTALTAPVASSTVPIMVFVRGAENLEFANPHNYFSEVAPYYSYLAPQGEETLEEKQKDENIQDLTMGGIVHSPAPQRYLINFGEAIQNMRQVLRRASITDVRTIGSAGANVVYCYKRKFTRWPLAYGFDTAGWDSVKGLIATGTNFQYNFSNFHPITYISSAFIGTRGATIYHFNVENTQAIEHIRVFRAPGINITTGETTVSSAAFASRSASAKFFFQNMPGGSAGQAVTNQLTQAGLSVSLPQYNNYKFESAAPTNPSFAQSTDGTGYDTHTLEVNFNGTAGASSVNTRMWTYCGIGSDFSLLFFLNVPTLFYYNTTLPTAN